MAAKAKAKEVSMEEALWKSADKLRGSVEPSEYKHVVLSLQVINLRIKEQESLQMVWKNLWIILHSIQKIMCSICRRKADGLILWKMLSRMILL
mgnify:CR=1 FL=1